MSVNKKSADWGKKFKLLCLALMLPVSAGWVGDSLLDLIKLTSPWWDSHIGWSEPVTLALGAFAGSVLFICTAMFLYKERKEFLAIHARILPEAEPQGRSVLIMGLSPKAGRSVATVDNAMPVLPIEIIALDKAGLATHLKNAKAVTDRTCSGLTLPLSVLIEKPHGWQQNFRAVWRHIKTGDRIWPLKAILVVTSNESETDFEEFKNLLTDRLKNAVRRGEFVGKLPHIENICPTSIDFEEYNDVVDALNNAVDIAVKRHQVTHNQICIDATAGLKIFSIAAAMVTLNRKLIFSYINNDGRPRYYDAKIDMGTLGEG